MSSFDNLLSRAFFLTEAKMSPYASAHPSFGEITSKMRAGGLSSAPLDTIKFIRETLYYLDIINDEELNAIKRGAGFTGKKQAMLSILKTKQQEINAKAQEIADRVTTTLDDFINGVGTNRGREEKYAAQAAAQEMANQMRQAKSGKQMDDALIDIVADESLLVKTAIAKILADIQKSLGEPGFDIEEEALSEVIDYSSKINTLSALKSFIQQIANEPGYEKIAAYLSSAVKPISQGTEDEEMQEEAEDDIHDWRPESIEEYPPYDELEDKLEDEEFSASKADINKNGKVEGWEKGLAKKRGFKSVPEDAEDLDSSALGNSKLTNQKVFSAGESAGLDPSEISILLQQALKKFNNSQKAREELVFVFNNIKNNKKDLSKFYSDFSSLYNAVYEAPEMMSESYTSHYLTEQTKKDRVNKPKKDGSVSFKSKYNPKTSWQLEELRRYGL